jgi:hypothetical protein
MPEQFGLACGEVIAARARRVMRREIRTIAW